MPQIRPVLPTSKSDLKLHAIGAGALGAAAGGGYLIGRRNKERKEGLIEVDFNPVSRYRKAKAQDDYYNSVTTKRTVAMGGKPKGLRHRMNVNATRINHRKYQKAVKKGMDPHEAARKHPPFPNNRRQEADPPYTPSTPTKPGLGTHLYKHKGRYGKLALATAGAGLVAKPISNVIGRASIKKDDPHYDINYRSGRGQFHKRRKSFSESDLQEIGAALSRSLGILRKNKRVRPAGRMTDGGIRRGAKGQALYDRYKGRGSYYRQNPAEYSRDVGGRRLVSTSRKPRLPTKIGGKYPDGSRNTPEDWSLARVQIGTGDTMNRADVAAAYNALPKAQRRTPEGRALSCLLYTSPSPRDS